MTKKPVMALIFAIILTICITATVIVSKNTALLWWLILPALVYSIESEDGTDG